MNIIAPPMRESIRMALDELGEPQPGYPAPVANAVDILRDALANNASGCLVCSNVRIELGGHPDSKLDGDEGLAAATMREIARLHGRVSADILKDALPGYLKIEDDAAPDFWAEYADNVRERLMVEDAPGGPAVRGEPCENCGRFTNPLREKHTPDCQYNVDELCAKLNRLKGDET